MDKELIQKVAELYKSGDISKQAVTEILKKMENEKSDDIAIIGIGCKTPTSDDYNSLWDIMKNRKSQIKPCPKERIGLTSKYLGKGGDLEEMYHHGAFFGDYEMFDCQMFGLSEEEATLMDPMQRIMLQSAYRTLEDAGYLGVRPKNDVTGVFIGANFTNKQFANYMTLVGKADFSTIMANWTNGVATRISHCFDLRGISTVIENSCIASIMAMSEACNQLRSGKISAALVGAVNTLLIPDKRISLNRVFAHESDMVSKPYDVNPNGNYIGEGAASLLLKPLKKAIEDGDKIHGLIKSSSINNNGRTSDFTQSNAEMISEVVRDAFNEAKIHPDEVDYVEGEGYCEKLEQALEVIGLSKGFSRFTNRKQYCALGAASTNLGYSEVAVGIFNAICCLLAMKHKQIPPISCFDNPSDVIDLSNTPFYVNDYLKDWNVEEGKKRTSAIFTQGFGGGNGFTILQEYSRCNNGEKSSEEKNILLISALSERSFYEYIKRYILFLEDVNNEQSFEDICYTAAVKRRHYAPYRLAVIASNKDDLYSQLKSYMDNKIITDTLLSGVVQMKNNSENKKNESNIQKSMEDKDYQSIARYYLEGYEINFSNLYLDGNYINVDLPMYPFDNVKCWI